MIEKIIILVLSLFMTTFNQNYNYVNKEINIFKQIPKRQEKKETKVVNKSKKVTNTKKTVKTVPVLATYKGNITAYGPDCAGCIGITASGYNVTKGNIYYRDKDYGKIRIVAADKSLPFGTIIRIKGLNNFKNPIIAIVLDRGSAIGFNKKVYFDLLYKSEKETDTFGKRKATFEILRRGY